MSNGLNLIVTDFESMQKEIEGIRTEVFVIEQNVPVELEMDGFDKDCVHVVVFDEKEPVATARLLPDGHIGRVAVRKKWRKLGIGKLIMQKLIDAARESNFDEIIVSAQCRVEEFYQKLGFTSFGEVYDDANIDHIDMRLKLK
ncbi:MAG: GNAT family N-acetyltransferase [Lentisphaerae bacterium]|nr:GNAT family N-acetyltransferase [Lentisphaerota bacterium]MCP4103724.1 GNAT family N-acetyltransferase [Lentisphaerota bacterium]